MDRNRLEQEAKKLTILYVEDSRSLRELVRTSLADKFGRVDCAENGEQGYKLFLRESYDAVLTDIMMPVMDGVAMVRKIREMDKEVPIVMATSMSEEKFLLEAIELGVDRFIKKGPEIEPLVEALYAAAMKTLQRRELESKNAELLQQSREVAVARTIAMLAHQWRQPLTIINMGAGNMAMDLELGNLDVEGFKKTCATIGEKAAYLSGLIDEFARIARPSPETEPLDAGKLVRQAVEMLGPQLELQEVSVELSGEEELWIRGHRSQLFQTLMALLRNGMEAIERREVRPGNIRVTWKEEGEKGVIEVADNGGGIAPEAAADLFQPYVSTKREQHGVGLGLYAAKSYLESDGGSITGENRGDGALFRITLPLA